MELKIKKWGGWLLLVLLLFANVYIGACLYAQNQSRPDSDPAYDNIEIFARTLELVRSKYVDSSQTGYRELVRSALEGMLSSLDRHSQFMSPDSYEEMRDETEGSFGGLGIVISMKNGVLTVVSTMDATPAFRAGIRAGDQIVAIDGKSTEEMTIQDAVLHLKGEVGTEVELEILRADDQYLQVELTRAQIEVHSVKGTRLIEDGIGYIRLAKFAKTTVEDLLAAIAYLQDEGMEAIILDLRNNPGGLLQAAVGVVDLFLDKDSLIVYTQGRQDEKEYRSERDPVLPEEIPMAILVNAGSASGAEIVAGALQDHNRAVLVGEKTFGKGSVQAVFPVNDGSAVRLTVSKYYTPSERVIHEHGIEPDIVLAVAPSDWARIRIMQMRDTDGGDEQEFGAAEMNDLQLQKAIDVLEGVMFYTENNGK